MYYWCGTNALPKAHYCFSKITLTSVIGLKPRGQRLATLFNSPSSNFDRSIPILSFMRHRLVGWNHCQLFRQFHESIFLCFSVISPLIEISVIASLQHCIIWPGPNQAQAAEDSRISGTGIALSFSELPTAVSGTI